MTIAAVGAVGADPSQTLKQAVQAAENQAGTGSTAQAPNVDSISLGNSIPASVEVAPQVSNAPTQPGFANSVLDGVYSQIDKLSSKVPNATEKSSPIDTYKNDMASKVETLNPSETSGLQPKKDDKVEALSKTFDHAIFMAMVNQVVSGVSDTSRTLIKQS